MHDYAVFGLDLLLLPKKILKTEHYLGLGSFEADLLLLSMILFKTELYLE